MESDTVSCSDLHFRNASVHLLIRKYKISLFVKS